jgi:hypothetical protein
MDALEDSSDSLEFVLDLQCTDENASLEMLAFDLDALLCESSLVNHEVEISFEWIDTPLVSNFRACLPPNHDCSADEPCLCHALPNLKESVPWTLQTVLEPVCTDGENIVDATAYDTDYLDDMMEVDEISSQYGQRLLKEKCLDPLEHDKELWDVPNLEPTAIVVQPRPPPSPNPSTGHHETSDFPRADPKSCGNTSLDQPIISHQASSKVSVPQRHFRMPPRDTSNAAVTADQTGLALHNQLPYLTNQRSQLLHLVRLMRTDGDKRIMLPL